MQLTTHLRTELRLRMSWTVPQLSRLCMGLTLPFLTDSGNSGDDDQINNNHICCGYLLLSPSHSRGCFIFSIKNMSEIVNKYLCPVSPFTIFKTWSHQFGRMTWSKHTLYTGQWRWICEVLLRKPAAARSLGRPGCRWKNIKMDRGKLGSGVCLASSDWGQGPVTSFCL